MEDILEKISRFQDFHTILLIMITLCVVAMVIEWHGR